MQQKKNIRLIISLAVLCIVTLSVYAFRSENTSVKIDKNIFRTADYKSVSRIMLESKSDTIELRFTGAHWMVNKTYEADRRMIDVLFATLQQAEPKRPVAAAIKDSLSQTLVSNGVKVSLFSGEQKVQSFYAGGNAQKTEAYFQNEVNGTPYTMLIPGYRVYVSGVLELDENGWRDKRIFNLNWQNFKELIATNNLQPDQNFKVAFADRYFSVEGVNTDTTKLNNYLDAVSYITAESFVPKPYSKSYDSLLNSAPPIVIAVNDIASRNYKLSLYAPLKKGMAVPGVINGNELVLFQPTAAAILFSGKNFFRKKP